MTHKDQLYAIWRKYSAKDYWCDDGIIANTKATRDRMRESFPNKEFPTDAEIEDHYHQKSLSFVHEQHARVSRAVHKRDLKWLVANVRYDQPLTLDLYELVTGTKVRGLSNKKLKRVFHELAQGAQDDDR